MADPTTKVKESVGGIEGPGAQSSNAGEKGTSAGRYVPGDSGAGKTESSPTKTYGASALEGGKTGGISDLTGGESSKFSDLTGSKEGDKAVSDKDQKGGLFSGITGSKGDEGISGLTGGKTGSVNQLTDSKTSTGVSDLTDNKWA